jgi:hypothetical protein
MLCAKTRSAKVNIFMTLCTTLSFSYTIVGTHQGEPDPKRWPLSIVSVPTTHIIGFFIIWATNIYDDGKYLSGDGSICNSEERQCGLYYHTKKHTLAFLGRSLTFLGVLVSKRPRVPSRLCVDSAPFPVIKYKYGEYEWREQKKCVILFRSVCYSFFYSERRLVTWYVRSTKKCALFLWK